MRTNPIFPILFLCFCRLAFVILNRGLVKHSTGERQLSGLPLGLTGPQKILITQMEEKLDRKKAELDLMKGDLIRRRPPSRSFA